MNSPLSTASPRPSLSGNAAIRSARIVSIDALRGLVILLMLVDHAREFFYLHAQVGDPMDAANVDPALFFTRLTAHLCAPVFVALTGLAAFLYGDAKGGAGAASGFLFRRGLFLVALEWSMVSFGWSFDLTPDRFFLQVIWAIGLSMIALAGLVHLPRPALIAAGLGIVLGHNLLDGVTVAPSQWGHTVWAILHERVWLDLPWGAKARVSYPLLPWIGVIALGYAIGPWFRPGVAAAWRQRRLVLLGCASLALFLLLRTINLYGDRPWRMGETPLRSAMSFLNLTKYPPSADFLLLTLGVGALLLAAFERVPARIVGWLVVFGSAPLFFYLLHLYLLHALNLMANAIWGAEETQFFSLPDVTLLWLVAAALAVPCWFACRWFAARKRASGAWWMRYL
ncbi:heparan-alpha-glucosaminide N-acetyltransferase domain-containing protein [Sphingomonas sp. G-3-2-10]|uniref:DUF1624 domain-containing protein n=1 Tax=Sphingomonas sp. G-3-2-10 TaxID=2728838 RepID=UPI00146BA758|nr:heparan-alpha-glucosaminide N-acetyltransferase domain-containing protein [Sphingomonas sp. G-3-2-10]NML05617.1 DUF1624 domain-containing protein [Sphingomonas sp. G-3-2-10]